MTIRINNLVVNNKVSLWTNSVVPPPLEERTFSNLDNALIPIAFAGSPTVFTSLGVNQGIPLNVDSSGVISIYTEEESTLPISFG